MESKDIQSECDQLTGDNQALVLLHKGSPDWIREIPEEFNTATDDKKICLFGGGEEMIYEYEKIMSEIVALNAPER